MQSQLAQSQGQRAGVGQQSPIAIRSPDASESFLNTSSTSSAGFRRSTGKLPAPPLFSNDEADKGKAGFTEYVFEWVKRMNTYVQFNESDAKRQAQLAVNYLQGSAEAEAQAHMELSESTWETLQAHLLTTMLTPAHVARLRQELIGLAQMRGKHSVKSVVETFQAIERKIASLPRVHGELCEMQLRTRLEFMKEGLPAGCVATLNLKPPESLRLAYDAVLRWARAHEASHAAPPPPQLNAVQGEGIEWEVGDTDAECYALGEYCYKCGGTGHYARDMACPQHPNHQAQHPNHQAPPSHHAQPFQFAGAPPPAGGYRGGARGGQRGALRGAPRGGWTQRGPPWRGGGRGAPHAGRPAAGGSFHAVEGEHYRGEDGMVYTAAPYDSGMRYEDYEAPIHQAG